MPKQALPVMLKQEERAALVRLTRRHSRAQQVVLRARVVLEASEGKSNAAIARELSTNVETVRLWRGRWVAQQEIELADRAVEERLADAPRPGAPSHISAEQRTQMATLACEAPAKTGRPISQWTGREIADELKVRGIITQISPRHAARLLKRGLPAAPVSVLANRGRRLRAGRENRRGVPGLCPSCRTSQTGRTHHQPG